MLFNYIIYCYCRVQFYFHVTVSYYIFVKYYIITNPSDKIAYFITEINFPHFIWLMEFYTIGSYKKGECFAEVILDATAGQKEDGTLYMRLFNKLYCDKK